MTVPAAETHRDQTGNRICASSLTSRQPASMTSPRTPRAASAVASSSPKYPSSQRDVGATTRTSPSAHCSTATWIIQLSPGGTLTVTAVPEIRGPAYTGLRYGASRPLRPWASCVVATPNSANASAAARSARRMLRTTMAIGYSPQGSSDTWMTSSSPPPPIALIARSTSGSPKVWVTSMSSGNRPEASCLTASSQAR